MKIDRYRATVENILANDELPKKIALLGNALQAIRDEQPKVYEHCSNAIDSDNETSWHDWEAVYCEFFNNARFGRELGNRLADNPDATVTANTEAFCVLCDNTPEELNQWEGEPTDMQRPEEITETLHFIDTDGHMVHKVVRRGNPFFVFARHRGNRLFQLGRMVQNSGYDTKEALSVVTLKLLLYIAIKNELADLNTEASITANIEQEPAAPQQEPAAPQQATKESKPGRKPRPFIDLIKVKVTDKESYLSRLHEMIDGQSRTVAMDILYNAISNRFLSIPSHNEFTNEFPSVTIPKRSYTEKLKPLRNRPNSLQTS